MTLQTEVGMKFETSPFRKSNAAFDLSIVRHAHQNLPLVAISHNTTNKLRAQSQKLFISPCPDDHERPRGHAVDAPLGDAVIVAHRDREAAVVGPDHVL